MRFIDLVSAVLTLSQHTAHALLEEKFVTFVASNGSLNIAGATIIADVNDYVGVHIALNSLVHDYEQILGTRPTLRNATANSTIPAVGSSSIIIGSLNSSLIRQLSTRGVLDVTDLEEKWEMFQTSVVERPIAGVDRALVITGSDKRGTIFGIHTLSEQSGQSP